MIIKAQHPQLNKQFTRLSVDVLASATSSTVDNNEGMTTGDYILFGKYGEDKTEIVILTSVTGGTTLGHTTGPVFPHPANTQITEIDYNQVEFYRSGTEDGDYTLIATVSITPDSETTIYNDTAGTSANWYKVRYKNSTAGTYSGYSVAMLATGYTDDSLRSIVDDVLEEYGDPESKEISRVQVRRLARTAVRKMMVNLIKVMPDYRRQYTTQVLTSTNLYDLPTRFLAFNRIDINFTGTTATEAYKARFDSERNGEPNTVYQTSDPVIFFRGTQWGIKPTPTTGMAFLWYWDYPIIMTDDNDEHGLPFGAKDSIVAYCLFRLWASKDQDKMSTYRSEYSSSVDDWIEFASQSKQKSTTMGIEVVFGSDLYSFENE